MSHVLCPLKPTSWNLVVKPHVHSCFSWSTFFKFKHCVWVPLLIHDLHPSKCSLNFVLPCTVDDLRYMIRFGIPPLVEFSTPTCAQNWYPFSTASPKTFDLFHFVAVSFLFASFLSIDLSFYFFDTWDFWPINYMIELLKGAWILELWSLKNFSQFFVSFFNSLNFLSKHW